MVDSPRDDTEEEALRNPAPRRNSRSFEPSASSLGGKTGFTLVEVLTAISVLVLLMAFGASSLRERRETAIVRAAAGVIASDIAFARSAAMKLRRNVSIVAREESLGYVVRDEYGTELLQARSFAEESELPLGALDVRLPGDSLTFGSRGMVLSSGTSQIDLIRADRLVRIEVNGLGRYRIVE